MFMCGMCYVHMYRKPSGIFLLILMLNNLCAHVRRSTQYKYKGFGAGAGAGSTTQARALTLSSPFFRSHGSLLLLFSLKYTEAGPLI